jgi:hypothetical protein
MQPTKSLILGASLGALLNLSATGGAEAKATDEQSSKEMAKQIKALREQIDALQRKVDAQAAAEQASKDQAAAAQSQAAAAAASANAAKAAAASIPAQVQTAVDAAKPKTDKIYYKGVTLTLGGFGAAETIYRSRNETADMASTFSGIPFNNSSVGHASELRFSARQSRITALAEGDPTQDVHLSFYGEMDFLGAAQTANSNETNSYTPRMRVLYNQIDWADEGLHFLAGQNWSLVTMQGKGETPRSEDIVPTIDAQYIPGFSFARQPQLRLTKDFDKQVWVGLSLENPQTTFYTGPNAYPASVKLTDSAAGGSGFNSANTLSLNHIPDVVLKVAVEPTIAERTVHAEVFGLYRSFFERLDYQNQDSSGGGIGAGLVVPVVPEFLDFRVSGLGGKGIGRYGAAQLADVTFNSAGVIKPISEIQALAGLTLHASPALDVYLFAGEEKESAEAYYGTSATGALVGYGYGNPLYVNSGCASETATGACTGNTRLVEQATTGFWFKPWLGSTGKYQIGMQYSYTERKSFSGAAGITPVTNDSMVFASFRYYPFNAK